MSSIKRLLFVTPLAVSLILTACGDDDDAGGDGSEAGAAGAAHQQGGSGGTGSPSHGGSEQGGQPHGERSLECEALGSLCHAEDSGAGPISDCHDTGHVGDADACTEQFASCITACVANEGGEGGAGGTGLVANPYCQALGELCHFVNDEGTPTAECHEVGHVGNEADCIPAFAECVPVCLEKRQAEGGMGGAGPHAEGGGGAHSEGGGNHQGGAGG